MEILFNGRKFNVVEYDKEVHGELKNLPTDFANDIVGQDLETQLKRFRIDYSDYTKEVFYKDYYEKVFKYSSYITYKDYYFNVNDIVVKDGIVVAVTYNGGYDKPKTLQLFDSHYLYEAEDNNGAGYKTSDVYVTLLFK